jgi:hypothetical protein
MINSTTTIVNRSSIPHENQTDKRQGTHPRSDLHAGTRRGKLNQPLIEEAGSSWREEEVSSDLENEMEEQLSTRTMRAEESGERASYSRCSLLPVAGDGDGSPPARHPPTNHYSKGRRKGRGVWVCEALGFTSGRVL